MMAPSIAGNRLLGDFARVAEHGKQENARNETEEFANRGHHGIPLRIPALISRTARNEARTAHQSIPRAGLRGRKFVVVIGIGQIEHLVEWPKETRSGVAVLYRLHHEVNAHENTTTKSFFRDCRHILRDCCRRPESAGEPGAGATPCALGNYQRLGGWRGDSSE